MMERMRSTRAAVEVVAVALMISACGRSQVVAEGDACTSPYQSQSPRRVCAAPDRCLLMLRADTYRCVRSCKTDGDCDAGHRCEHYNGHGDEHGCVKP
jgi:hypothetical protein